MKIILLITLMTSLFISLVGCQKKQENNYEQLSIANPFRPVASSDDFSNELGFIIEAPSNVNQIVYHIINNKIAQIDFELDDINYTLRASKIICNDLHGVYDTLIKSDQYFINDDIEVLIKTTTNHIKIVTWTIDSINYSLTTDNLVDNEILLTYIQDSSFIPLS